MSSPKPSHMTPGAYRALGSVAGLIGLSASTVATWFFILGLLQTERDETARQALIAASVLLTVGQLAAFGIAAALPRDVLRGVRAVLLSLGAALFIFEVGSMAITQLALVQSADATKSAAGARIEELQAAISNRRAVAAGRRELAATQAQAQAITAAARTLRQADDAEATIAPLAAELQQLQAARRPTLTSLLGADHTALYATLRAALIGLVGLVFMSAAGALFRTARDAQAAPAVAELTPTSKGAPAAVRLVDQARAAAAAWISPAPATALANSVPAGTTSEVTSAPVAPAPGETLHEHRRLHALPNGHGQRRRRRSTDHPNSRTNAERRAA